LIPKTGVANFARITQQAVSCFALIPKTGVANLLITLESVRIALP